jgi:hypothetical protein
MVSMMMLFCCKLALTRSKTHAFWQYSPPRSLSSRNLPGQKSDTLFYVACLHLYRGMLACRFVLLVFAKAVALNYIAPSLINFGPTH